MPDENDQNLNPGQSDYEQKTAFNPNGKNTNENSDQNSTASDLKNAEENPNKEWDDNFTGKNTQKKQGTFSKIFKSKKGASITIIGGLASVVGVIGFFGSPALITQTIMANFLDKYNSHQETSLSRRYSRLISSRLVGDSTSGFCDDIVKIACRYTRPSNAFLKKMEKYGLKAYDSKGLPIEKNNSLFPNARPAKYTFSGADGRTIDVEAKNIYTEFLNNAELRSAFNSASRMRFISLTDDVFKKIKARFGFKINNETKAVVDTDELTDELDTKNTVDDDLKGLAGDEAASKNAAKEIVSDAAKKEASTLTKALKGSAVTLVPAVGCVVSDIPSLVTRTARSFQMMQLVRYSAVFMSAFGAIKAGDATPQQMTAIGNVLTKVVNKKSAMDSFGMKHSITGDTKSTDENYKKFSPGLSSTNSLKGVNAVLDSKAANDSCAVALNPATGEAINLALALNAGDTLGASLVVGGVNMGAGWALSVLLGAVLPPAIDFFVNVMPTEKILSSFYGDLTKGIEGEEVGDAIASGASHMMGQTGNAGGNMPLSVPDAVAYEKISDEVKLAYAEEDRVTKSIFDISSPNTLLGSIAQNISPYFIRSSLGLSTIATKLGSMVNFIFGSFGSLIKPISTSAADEDYAKYQLCEDPAIKNNDIAAGPFCNIIYGVPEKYLNIEPYTVVTSLVASGDIDENTGAVKEDSDLSNWITLCTDGTTSQSSNCKVTDRTSAYFSLYTIDTRVMVAMDGTE